MLKLLAMLSLILCVATAAVWASSYWAMSFVGRQWLDPNVDMTSAPQPIAARNAEPLLRT
jgi:hypothetical protein